MAVADVYRWWMLSQFLWYRIVCPQETSAEEIENGRCRMWDTKLRFDLEATIMHTTGNLDRHNGVPLQQEKLISSGDLNTRYTCTASTCRQSQQAVSYGNRQCSSWWSDGRGLGMDDERTSQPSFTEPEVRYQGRLFVETQAGVRDDTTNS